MQPDGRLVDTRTCIANAHAFNGKTIITIEGQAKTDAEGNVTELTPIQKAFIEKFFVPVRLLYTGFVAGATAFIDRLKHEPVKRADLESAIEDALNDPYLPLHGVRAVLQKPCAMSPSPRPAV